MIYNVYVPKKLVLPDDFSRATWEEIVAACQKKKVPQSWAVGNSKVVMDKYGEVFFTADIIGKNHDDYSDGSGKAPLTLQTHDLYGELWAMNDESTNAGGWKQCYVRTDRLPEVLESFPEPIKSAVRAVEKKTSAGGQSSSLVITSDYLFLLSEIELTGDNEYSQLGEGNRYAYYESNDMFKKYGSSVYTWWLRSPMADNGEEFCVVNNAGNIGTNMAEEQNGISFAFCL